MFLVTGITGNVGGAAAHRLLKNGHAVRALARDPKKAAAWSEKGVEVRQGDFTDVGAITEALQGVEAAYLMVPPLLSIGPGFPEAKAMIATFSEALRKAPPPRLVVLSSVGSEQSSKLGLITTTHLLEEALADLPFPTAFVRAGSFLENYAFALGPAASTGYFDTFLIPTDRRFMMVAAEDIGNEVARLLTSKWSGRKVVELGSPMSADDLAGAMGNVLGRPIEARSIPRDQWTARLRAQGMEPVWTAMFEEMEDGFNSGWIASGVPGTEPVAATLTATEFFTKLRNARA
ncbi:putative nucleoside-diphosphate-sugar epimerase [Labilithrix luteola]|uniref:Putative nucleoside-diphosphate-sugar epimerase n=1 Tax=Labilithrix luteola TaxID=1391654 RepID=A0A0K1QFE0_9BACT|nr:NmrA family NAD(P)-binding protein [Labilithrix luteola]AKV04479.1 putative nucleoside-diphosphate-sugar epimerase [Labilithrix luteola]